MFMADGECGHTLHIHIDQQYTDASEDKMHPNVKLFCFDTQKQNDK